ncbi:MAG: hypothetical protein ACRCVJ_18700 [Clostridium sp.]|uniref:hypothetical protein n=1 Tax=Clostridium sp. TaxID=1506 RepID=UPI003F3924B5
MVDNPILLDITDSVYRYYKFNTHKGLFLNRDEVRKKLTRAYIQGVSCWDKENYNCQIEKRRYGNIEIIVNKTFMTIEKIINHKGYTKGSMINAREKEDLKVLYGA